MAKQKKGLIMKRIILSVFVVTVLSFTNLNAAELKDFQLYNDMGTGIVKDYNLAMCIVDASADDLITEPSSILNQETIDSLSYINCNEPVYYKVLNVEGISTFKNLEEINLYMSIVSETKYFSGLEKLHTLDLGRNKIANVSETTNLPSLTNINLSEQLLIDELVYKNGGYVGTVFDELHLDGLIVETTDPAYIYKPKEQMFVSTTGDLRPGDLIFYNALDTNLEFNGTDIVYSAHVNGKFQGVTNASVENTNFEDGLDKWTQVGRFDAEYMDTNSPDLNNEFYAWISPENGIMQEIKYLKPNQKYQIGFDYRILRNARDIYNISVVDSEGNVLANNDLKQVTDNDPQCYWYNNYLNFETGDNVAGISLKIESKYSLDGDQDSRFNIDSIKIFDSQSGNGYDNPQELAPGETCGY